MATHLEEYLEMNNKPQFDSEHNIISAMRNPSAENSDPFVYDPREERIGIPHMSGTNIAQEQQRTMLPAPSEARPTYPRSPTSSRPLNKTQRSSSSIHQRPSARDTKLHAGIVDRTETARKTSSTYSESPISTPAAYTPSPRHRLPTSSEASGGEQLTNSRKRPLESRSSTPILQNDHTLEETLIQTFVRLDGQGLFFGMIPGIPPLIWDIHESHHIPIPNFFSDFPSAHRCWDFLQDRALQFYRRTLFNKVYAPGNSETSPQIARQHASFIKQIEAFSTAFEPVLANARDPDGTITNPAAFIISLYQKITLITLAAVRTDSEMVYDLYNLDFKYIIQTCRALMLPQNATQSITTPRYTHDVGVVPPLHVTATKCRDPVIRREAIDLLFASPRQEGMWDGVLTARIGTWMIASEEDGLPPPPVESRESSNCHSPKGDWAREGRFSYPTPPQVVDEMEMPDMEGWMNGGSISGSVNEVVAGGRLLKFMTNKDWGRMINTDGMELGKRVVQRRKSSAKGRKKPVQERGWFVPEENRVQLTDVDFHIPDRYIKVKCQKTLLREDGTREERETVIAW